MSNYHHIFPLFDFKLHKLEGKDCWCKPRIDNEDDLVIHNALDEREAIENGERKIQ